MADWRHAAVSRLCAAVPAAAASAACWCRLPWCRHHRKPPSLLQTLIRLEDTIIFSLIERAQFARNEPVYEPDAIPVGAGRMRLGLQGSLSRCSLHMLRSSSCRRIMQQGLLA